MAYTLWSQDVFSRGELSPFMYARASVNEYYNGLKTAQNVLTYPTGAAGKRFGTLFQAQLGGFTPTSLYFETFQYLNECVYQLIFRPDFVDIYLEGILAHVVGSTGLDGEDVYNLSTTVIGAAFRIAGQGFKPLDLVRSPNAPNAIVSTASNTFTLTTPVTAGQVLPVRFTAAVMPVTDPPIKAGITYFVKNLTTTTVAVYATSYNAKFDIDRFTISTAGTTANLIYQNAWGLNPVVFKSVPTYDYNGAATSYDGINFTPSATSGNAVTITLSSAYAPLTTAYVGGSFIGGGGVARIISVADTTHFTVATQVPFDSTTAISGTLVFLGEPVWSDARGWPQKCSSYQNRALFANNDSLPNGFWASVVNDYYDFDDLQADDDNAISWYPSSDNVNFIRFIVPYRSVTVHTNTGIYSSPLSDVAAITPSNFSLQLQDSTPADVLQPQAIDNQILVLSGNDAHQMLWDGINNAYTSDIVSIINEQTIRTPVDETAFRDLTRAGSRFVFIVNQDGSMAAFQTLLSQGVSGFTPQIMEQSYGHASFLQVASSSDGRCWFVVQRDIPQAASPVAISGFTSTTLKAVASNFSQTSPTAVTFTTSGVLPASHPQITGTNYFWVIGVDADDFKVYSNQEDAAAGVSAITFTSAGTLSNVVPWPLTTFYTLEELTNSVFIDCATQYNGSPVSSLTIPNLYNAQDIVMVGDGFGFSSPAEDNIGNVVNFISHGQPVNVSNAYVGFAINTIIEPMPLSISMTGSAKTSGLTKPTHIRFVRFMFNQTIGGTINGKPIALSPFNQADIGQPPQPAMGIFELAVYSGWDDFNNPTYTIEHSDPFNIILLGVFYSVETS